MYHEDPTGAAHHLYSEGLNLALNRYLNHRGFEIPLQEYFNFKVPKITVDSNLIANYLKE